jgi:ABC-2 type transport system ATP-binding protein
MRDLIRSLAADRTVLLSTHILSEVEATCDRALVIDRGRLVAQGSLEDLSRLRETSSTRFVLRGDRSAAMQSLKQLSAKRVVEPRALAQQGPDVFAVEVVWNRGEQIGAAVERAIALLVSAGISVREASPHRATLEEVFALLTEDATAAEDRSLPDEELAS